jgi:hypothetical protein
VVNWLLMRARPVYYSFKIGLNLLLLATGWTAFALLGRSWWQMLAVVFLAVMFTQTGFIGHDPGHRQISGSKRLDGLIGRIHGNLLIGLSYGWWVAKHNRHHAHPNQIGRDPDIGGRAIAVTPGQIRARRRVGGGWAATKRGYSSRCCSRKGFICTSRACRRCWAIPARPGGLRRACSRFTSAAISLRCSSCYHPCRR